MLHTAQRKGDSLHPEIEKRMQFIRSASWFKVTRITGPSHNLLALEFCEPDRKSEIVVESLPSIGSEPPALLADDLRRHVAQGVAEANREFGTNYLVKRIQFVPNDSPPPEIYRYLAHSIVERLAKGMPFDERV